MKNNNWPNVARIVHLPGGGRAINPPGPEVDIEPSKPLKSEIKFALVRYSSLLGYFMSGSSPPIGVDFYEMPDQVQGHVPPFWRPFHSQYSDGYPTAKAEDLWSCIANAGFESGQMNFTDISRRIAFEIKACSWRLRDLSNSYNTELRALCEKNKFKQGNKFKTLNSFLVSLATHAFLVDICTLRDYLSEFLAAFVFSKYNKEENLRIVNLSVLRKEVLRFAKDENEFAAYLYEITDKNSANGWLATLGAYRDLVVHSVPLVQATHIGFLQQRVIDIGNGQNVPSIYFPIPPDPNSVARSRSKGELFSTPEEWIKASVEFDPEKESAPDALNYCACAMGQMSSLLIKTTEHSPVAPKRAHIDASDVNIEFK